MKGITRPRSSVDSAPYWEACCRGELLYQQCTSCAEVVFHPRALCPYCLADALAWKKSSGRARMYSFSIQHVALHPDGATYRPRMLGIAAVEEGYHMFTEFLADDLKAVRIDDPLQVVFEQIDDGLVLPKFKVLPR